MVLQKNKKKLTGAGEKLLKLNNLKGKLSNRVATLLKNISSLVNNVTCPTCTQNIEESFRLNRINDVQTKAKELKKGYDDLEETIKEEQEPRTSIQSNYQRRLLNSTMAFLKTILRFLDFNDRSEIWNQKFKDLPNNLQIEVLKMKN